MIRVTTLAVEGNKVLVLTPSNRVVVLDFPNPMPCDHRVGYLSEDPPEAVPWDACGNIVVPVFQAETPPIPHTHGAV